MSLPQTVTVQSTGSTAYGMYSLQVEPFRNDFTHPMGQMVVPSWQGAGGGKDGVGRAACTSMCTDRGDYARPHLNTSRTGFSDGRS